MRITALKLFHNTKLFTVLYWAMVFINDTVTTWCSFKNDYYETNLFRYVLLSFIFRFSIYRNNKYQLEIQCKSLQIKNLKAANLTSFSVYC